MLLARVQRRARVWPHLLVALCQGHVLLRALYARGAGPGLAIAVAVALALGVAAVLDLAIERPALEVSRRPERRGQA